MIRLEQPCAVRSPGSSQRKDTSWMASVEGLQVIPLAVNDPLVGDVFGRGPGQFPCPPLRKNNRERRQKKYSGEQNPEWDESVEHWRHK
mmetsp:Transcript_95438/g.174887  ORF Transcript_95438/g.174887 Transcript_95438/m.174887 type:complete len:89 (-) Transcript_95438:144-410(-)